MSTGAWHPDPTRRHSQRWWDGNRWTDFVADGGVTGTDAIQPDVDPSPDPASPSDNEADTTPCALVTTEDRQVFDELTADPTTEVVALGELAVVRCDIAADVGLGCDAYGPLFVIQGDLYLGVELSNPVWPDDLTQDEVLDALSEVGSSALTRLG